MKRIAILFGIVITSLAIVGAMSSVNQAAAEEQQFKTTYIENCSNAMPANTSEQSKAYCGCAYDRISALAGGYKKMNDYLARTSGFYLAAAVESCMGGV